MGTSKTLGLTPQELKELLSIDRRDLKELFVEATIVLGTRGIITPAEVKDYIENVDYYLSVLEEQ